MDVPPTPDPQKWLSECADKIHAMAARELSADRVNDLQAADLAQETIVDMQSGIGKFQGTCIEEFYRWAKEILRHNLIDHVRKRHRGLSRTKRAQALQAVHMLWEMGMLSPDDTPSTAAMRREDIEMVKASLKALDPDYEMVIRLRSLEEKTFAQVASEMGRSDEACRKLWARAMTALRREFSLRK